MSFEIRHRAVCVKLLREFEQEPGFAYSGFADNADTLSPSIGNLIKDGMQRPELVFASDERTERAHVHQCAGRVAQARSRHLICTNGARLPGYRNGRNLFESHIVTDQSCRRLTAKQHARQAMLLKRFDRNGQVADDGGWPAVADFSHDDEARMQGETS